MKKELDIFEDDEETLEDKLYNVRQKILALTELSKKYSTQLLEDFKTKKVRRGSRFKISLRQTLKVTSPEAAKKWAEERNCMDIDTAKAMRLIRREFTVPEGFAINQTEFLSMSRSHDVVEDED